MAFVLVMRVLSFRDGSSVALPWKTCRTEMEATDYCGEQTDLINQQMQADPSFQRHLGSVGITGMGHSWVVMQDPDSRIVVPVDTNILRPS